MFSLRNWILFFKVQNYILLFDWKPLWTKNNQPLNVEISGCLSRPVPLAGVCMMAVGAARPAGARVAPRFEKGCCTALRPFVALVLFGSCSAVSLPMAE